MRHARFLSRFIILLLISFWLAGCADSGNSGDDDNPTGRNIAPPTTGDVLPPPPTGAGLYDLYGTDTQSRGTIPFAVNWPIAPTTTQTLNVPGGTSLSAALATPNATIYVAAGSYGTFAPSADHQEWILDDAAIFNGISVINRNNISVTGGVINEYGGDNSLAVRSNDISYENVRISMPNGTGILDSYNRVSFVQCTLDASAYGLFHYRYTTNYSYDLILAGNYISGVQTNTNAVRLMGTRRVILVDNRLVSYETRPTFRSHMGSGDVWLRRNMAANSGGILMTPEVNTFTPLETFDYMGDHWIYDFEQYTTSTSSAGLLRTSNYDPNPPLSTSWPGILVGAGNRQYHDAGQFWWNAQPGDPIFDNQILAGRVAPALGSWLTTRGLPPGADH